MSEPVQVLTIPSGGLERRFLVFRPDFVGRTGSAPGVLFLPGTGATPAWAEEEVGWSALAAREGFVLVIPEALPPHPHRPPKFLTNPPRWNDHAADGPDDVGFLEAVIADLRTRGWVDPRRVYLTGFSNGAGMTFRFAAERAELVAAIAPVAGHCWLADPRPRRPVPTLYLIGTNDPLIPLQGGPVRLPWGGRIVERPPVRDTLHRWAAAVGCSPEARLVSETDGVREERFPGPAEFRAVFVQGLGHHWPGGRGRLHPRIGGHPSDRLSANERIWQFFRRMGSGNDE